MNNSGDGGWTASRDGGGTASGYGIGDAWRRDGSGTASGWTWIGLFGEGFGRGDGYSSGWSYTKPPYIDGYSAEWGDGFGKGRASDLAHENGYVDGTEYYE